MFVSGVRCYAQLDRAVTHQVAPPGTRRCYDHFAQRHGRARVYEHGGHLASIVGTATVKELVDATSIDCVAVRCS